MSSYSLSSLPLGAKYRITDPQKRAAYDRSGADPEARFGSGPPPGSSPGFATSQFRGGGGFDGELSPEDLFNMFFGGGMGPGGGFGGGPGTPTSAFRYLILLTLCGV